MWRTTTASSCELKRNIYFFTSVKFIGDDREEEEELMTRIVLELIIYMKKLLDSDWLRTVQFFLNTMQKRGN